MLDSRILLVGGTIRLTVPTYASEVLTTPSNITVTAYKNGSATGDSITPSLDYYGTGLSLVSYSPTVVQGDTITLKISATVSGTTRVTVAEFPVVSTAAMIAQAVWDVLTSGLTTAGSIGKYLVDRIIGTLAAGTHQPQGGDSHAVVTNGTYGNAAIQTTASSAASSAASAASSAASAASSAATAATNASAAASAAESVLTTAMTESYPTDGSTATAAQALYLLMAHHGESSINGTTKTVKKVDGTTTAATFTLNSATTPTSITRSS